MSNRPYVIVGAGHAARRASEALREHDQETPIVMIGAENELPYDRPALSKEALTSESGEKRAFIRDQPWYSERRIELRLGLTVVELDRAAQTVQSDDGAVIGYKRLLLATGSRVRRFAGQIDEGAEVHYVRTVADARALRAVLQPEKRVAVLGGGFVGLEVAASATTLGCKVTVVEPASGLLRRSMPPVVGDFIRALHARRGVDVRLNTIPSAIHKKAGQVTVETDRGEIDADIVVIGIGVSPNVELAEKAGLAVDNGIIVDEHCRTSDHDVFAAGEVTMHFNPMLGRHVRVESWQVAENQPMIAAANMVGASHSYAEIPWLWSDQFDCNVQTLGLFSANGSLFLRGNPQSGSFCVLEIDDEGRLRAIAAVNAGREIATCRRLMLAGKPMDPTQITDTSFLLRSML